MPGVPARTGTSRMSWQLLPPGEFEFVPLIPSEVGGIRVGIGRLTLKYGKYRPLPTTPIFGTILFNNLGYRGDTNSSPSPSSVGHPWWHANTTRRSQSVV